MFASNYPVDKSDGVGAERLWVGWLEVVEEADAGRAMQVSRSHVRTISAARRVF